MGRRRRIFTGHHQARRARLLALSCALGALSVASGLPGPACAQTCVQYCSAGASDALAALLCVTGSEACACRAVGSVRVGGRARGTAADATGSILPVTGQTQPQRASNREAPASAVEDDGTQQVGAPFHFRVNDDATISDCVTNLTWEKKGRDDGLHDVDDLYAWSDTLELTIWDFVDALNRSCSDDPFVPCANDDDCTAYTLGEDSTCTNGGCSPVPPIACSTNTDCDIRESGTTCEEGVCSGPTHPVPCTTDADCTSYDAGVCGYAGHRDWRIPNVKELMNLIDYGANGPNVQPEFDADCAGRCTIEECSCTAQLFHWSSTTFEDTVTSAWAVGFKFGDVRGREKNSLRSVRAVRGPLSAAESGCSAASTTTTLPCTDDELDLCAEPTASDALELLLCATGTCPGRDCSESVGARASSVEAGTIASSTSTTTSTPTSTTTPPVRVTCDNQLAVLPVTGQTQSFNADKFQNSDESVDDDGRLQCGQPQGFSVRTDGTILDELTCLVWGKKTDDDDVLHDKDLKFTWSGGGQLTIWDWIFRINNRCALDETVECLDADPQRRDCASSSPDDGRPGGSCGFAGKRDWRIPNVKELHSIIDHGRSTPNLDTDAFNTECAGCTISDDECSCVATSFHWSSTSFDQRAGGSAWAVGFGFGDVRGRDKSTPFAVRAVRGPLERDAAGNCIED